MGRDEEALNGVGRPNVAPLMIMAPFEGLGGQSLIRRRRPLRKGLGLTTVLLVAREAARLLAIPLLIGP